MADIMEFNDVFTITRGTLNPGRLKLNKTGVLFKSTASGGRVDSIPLAEIEETCWMRVARGFGIKVTTKDGNHYKYDGFKEPEYEKLKDFYNKFFDMPLEKKDLSVKGWNWGSTKFKGTMMTFEVDNKAAFEIPLRDVSSATAGKNEVTIEFHKTDHENALVHLMEMRLFVPNVNDSVDQASEIQKQIINKADVLTATGESVVTFEEVACLTPRGRYTVGVFPTFIQLHGKTYDYKIPHQTILRLFLLPHQDNRFMFFVVSMDPPIRQGNTRYPFLIFQFEREEEMTCRLRLSEEEIEKYKGKISHQMNGPVFEVVSKIFNTICQRKITVPAQNSFKSGSSSCSITCSYKASNGLLYPLERGFIFVHKPAVHVRFDEINAVNFARGSTTGRTFDFEIELTAKGSTGGNAVLTFSSLPREEYTNLFEFVNKKNLRIKNKGLKGSSGNLDQMMESDDEHDAYLQKVKAEGRERYDSDDDDDDDSDEDDEDFDPNSVKDDDIREEFDSDVSTSSSSDDEDDSDSEKKKKKKKKEAKKRKSESRKDGASKPKKSRGEDKRSKKDKNAPKRSMSAYMYFFNEHRQQILSENPGIAFTDVSKKASEMWKAQSDRTKWDKMAKEDKERYETEMKVYKQKIADGEIVAPSKSTSKSSKKSSKSSGGSKDTKKSKNIKDMMNKKDTSKDGDKYKSKEFIESDDDSSSNSDGGEDSDADKSKSAEKPAAKTTRSKRGGGGDKELAELKDESEEEAEFSGEQSSSGDDSD